MKGSKEKVTMGSGEVFIDEFNGTLPEFEELIKSNDDRRKARRLDQGRGVY